MTYEVLFQSKAEKEFLKLDINVQRMILKKIERIIVRPKDFLERLSNSKYYKLRIENYRLIVDLIDSQLIILIIKVGHRKNIYDNLDI